MRFLKRQTLDRRTANNTSLYSDAARANVYVSPVGAGSLVLPNGTTAQQPASPSTGMMRYNTTTSEVEVYQSSAWRSLRYKEPGLITQQSLGAGDGLTVYFGPLNPAPATTAQSGMTWSTAQMATNMLVIVDNVLQLSGTNYSVTQNPTLIAGDQYTPALSNLLAQGATTAYFSISVTASLTPPAAGSCSMIVTAASPANLVVGQQIADAVTGKVYGTISASAGGGAGTYTLTTDSSYVPRVSGTITNTTNTSSVVTIVTTVGTLRIGDGITTASGSAIGGLATSTTYYVAEILGTQVKLATNAGLTTFFTATSTAAGTFAINSIIPAGTAFVATAPGTSPVYPSVDIKGLGGAPATISAKGIVAITGASGTAGTVTLTYTSSGYIPFELGQYITVAGFTGSTAGYNGTYQVTGAPTLTQVQYTNATTGYVASEATSAKITGAYNTYIQTSTVGKLLIGASITNTSGSFSCISPGFTITVGMTVAISGAFGTGDITGYVTPTLYYVIATNGSTTFQLSATAGGSAITTVVGTLGSIVLIMTGIDIDPISGALRSVVVSPNPVNSSIPIGTNMIITDPSNAGVGYYLNFTEAVPNGSAVTVLHGFDR